MFRWIKDRRFKPLNWIPKQTGKRYYHRATVKSHISPNVECVFVFSSEEKAKAWRMATATAITKPQVILDKIERSDKDGWMT